MTAKRSASRPNRPPNFFWQGLLIVLPVTVLAGLGFISLRQDKILAEHEATEHAQRLAAELAQAVWTDLTEARNPGLPTFKVDRAAELVFPAALPAVPQPRRVNSAELPPPQQMLWSSAQKLEREQSLDEAVKAWEKFMALSPREEFAAPALYQLALCYGHQASASRMIQTLELLLKKYPAALGETGVPLGPLARLKILETAVTTINFPPAKLETMAESLCSNAVVYPSAITPILLDKAAALGKANGFTDVCERWRMRLEDQADLRKLYAAARPAFDSEARKSRENRRARIGELKPPRLFWFESDGEWLGARLDEGTNGFWIVCAKYPLDASVGFIPREFRKRKEPLNVSQPTISAPFTTQSSVWRVTYTLASMPASLLRTNSSSLRKIEIPPYFTTTLELAENGVVYSNQPPSLVADFVRGELAGHLWNRIGYSGWKPPLALATVTKVEDGIEYLRCNVHLTNPQMLFARQRQRTALFSLLIVASAGAALLGFAAARRAFTRQLRLAEMKSNFVSSVSHELRAPIASVRLMAEGLERGRIQDAAKQNEYFRFIVQECRRLSSMIENVLDFSRIEQGRKEYEFEPTDLPALIEKTIALMAAQAAEREIRLETIITGEPFAAELDGRAIQQALVNLLDNALKHSPNNSAIRVGLEFPSASPRPSDGRGVRGEGSNRSLDQMPHAECPSSPRPSPPSAGGEGETSSLPDHASRITHHVLVWVEDSGDGIPPEEHKRIFERFYRCGPELRRETQGVGIGLSIVKHIVEAHGGRVLVRSAVGEGSRFTMELPVSNSEGAKTRRGLE